MMVTLFLRAAWCAVAALLAFPFVTWFARSRLDAIRICGIAFACIFGLSLLTLMFPLARTTRAFGKPDCRNAQLEAGQAVGHFDVISADGAPGKDLGDRIELKANSFYHLAGWAAAPDKSGPAAAVCLIVDGKLLATPVKLGFARPDVAKYFGIPALGTTGFDIAGPARALGQGSHTLDFAVVNTDGTATRVGTARTVKVYL